MIYLLHEVNTEDKAENDKIQEYIIDVLIEDIKNRIYEDMKDMTEEDEDYVIYKESLDILLKKSKNEKSR
jgi:hypothetical protein